MSAWGWIVLLAAACCRAGAGQGLPSLDVSGYVPHLDVNGSRLPDACLVDFAPTLSAPAGREGFLFAGTDGHFYFESGRRAVFWGINIANDAVFQPHDVIDAACDRLARAGFNLVRFHHLDGPQGLLPPDRAGQYPRVDPRKLDALDYWIAALKQRGIYVYIDLLSYRTFYQSEGVVNGEQLGRGAKPYAVFSERLIELQLQYARQLLSEHVNPYTGLAYCDDPAVCMIELCDENGLFITKDKWRELLPAYRQELVRRWNFWLRRRFSTTEALRKAWSGGHAGRRVLAAGESIEAGTVMLPGISDACPPSAGRTADVRRFMADVHREYFATMRDNLRRLGVKVPLLAVTDTTDPADVFSVAAELDAIGCNYYFSHPMFPAGNWRPPAFVTMNNPLGAHMADSLLRRLCGPRVLGKPLVLREFNICWPNPYRAAGLLQAAAYAALNDVDALILFTYDTRAAKTRLDYFNVARDPTRWGIAPLAGRIFLQRLIRPAPIGVAVAFGPQDMYRARDDALLDSIYELGGWCRMGNLFPLHAYPRRPDLLLEVSPGAGAGAAYFAAEPQAPPPALGPQRWRGQSTDALPALVREKVGETARLGPSEGLLDCLPRQGLLRLHGTGVEALAGNLANNNLTVEGGLQVRNGPSPGAVVWFALDGRPPAESRRWLLKLVGGAGNSGQQVTLHQHADEGDIYLLRQAGSGPIVTCTGAAEDPLIVSLAGNEILRVWARDAVVELARDNDRWLLFCDTPATRIRLPGLGGPVVVTAYNKDGRERCPGRPELDYPAGALLLEFTPAG